MDAATFRKLGHELVEWVADYRERLERLPVMSPARPGEIRARFPKEPPRTGGGLPQALARLDQDVLPGITHWNHPSFFAYFPSNTSYASILADIVASGLGVAGHELADEPGRHRGRGSRDGLAAPDGGPLRRLDRRRARHGQHRDAVRAPVRAREGLGLQPERSGAAGAESAARRVRLEPGPQLDREGGAARRLRPGQPAARRHRRRARAARGPAGGGDRRGSCRGPRAVRARRLHRHHRHHCDRPARRDGAGCAEARPVAPRGRRARRHGDGAARSAARSGTASSRPTAWSSTRTSGWAWASTSAPTTCATRST